MAGCSVLRALLKMGLKSFEIDVFLLFFLTILGAKKTIWQQQHLSKFYQTNQCSKLVQIDTIESSCLYVLNMATRADILWPYLGDIWTRFSFFWGEAHTHCTSPRMWSSSNIALPPKQRYTTKQTRNHTLKKGPNKKMVIGHWCLDGFVSPF